MAGFFPVGSVPLGTTGPGDLVSPAIQGGPRPNIHADRRAAFQATWTDQGQTPTAVFERNAHHITQVGYTPAPGGPAPRFQQRVQQAFWAAYIYPERPFAAQRRSHLRQTYANMQVRSAKLVAYIIRDFFPRPFKHREFRSLHQRFFYPPFWQYGHRNRLFQRNAGLAGFKRRQRFLVNENLSYYFNHHRRFSPLDFLDDSNITLIWE